MDTGSRASVMVKVFSLTKTKMFTQATGLVVRKKERAHIFLNVQVRSMLEPGLKVK